MALWSAFYDLVLPSLPGLPTGTPADHFIKHAAIEFLDRSLVYRLAIAAQNIVASTSTYVLTPTPANTGVAKVLEVRVSDRLLENRGEAWLKDHYGPGQDWSEVTSAAPEYWFESLPGSVRLVGIPNANITNGLTAYVAAKPTESATGVDDAIYAAHRREIADLAKAMAMEIEGAPYSNPKKAQSLRSDVDQRIGLVAYKRDRGGGDGAFRTRTHWI